MNRPNISKLNLENQGLICSLEIHRQSEQKDEHSTDNLVIWIKTAYSYLLLNTQMTQGFVIYQK